ncbi:acyltransferase [Sediminibacterium roseum]|uniref:Acyltransferase n=1 Tax=Sediminibacterium roseum TaxID=1978412 RepID=A0ABW9ZUH4_9BACT|nr:acyltransferase family protein [Sediminibacterium roseum]NCI50791.1 acyltransferase [Sediminibacterium roseum]
MKYRPEIDGLRAVAVVAVLLYHLDVPFVPGGLLGVDVFFVISGYLITSLLLASVADNTFSVAGFYERRARRILPALVPVLIFTTAGVCIIFNYYDSQTYAKSLVSVSVFCSNFFFWKTTHGYFGMDALQMPLLHTWSLSIEEQFYLVYPLIITAGSRLLKGRFIKRLLLLLFILSLSGYLWQIKQDANTAFYHSLLRSWELLAGGLLSAGILPAPVKTWVASVAGMGGMLCIVVACVLFGRIPGSSLFNLLAVVGACGIVYGSLFAKNFVSAVLSSGSFVFTGKISYSLYLWHWPLVVFARLLAPGDFSTPIKIGVGVLSFLLSMLSYYYVEQPFRKKNGVVKTRKKTLGAAVVVLLLTGLTGFALSKPGAFFKQSPTDLMFREVKEDPRWDSIAELGRTAVANPDVMPVPYAVGDTSAPANFLVWGDSFTIALASGVDSVCGGAGKHGYVLCFPSTPPLLGIQFEPVRTSAFMKLNNHVLHFIKQHPEITTVVLHANWLAFFANLGQAAKIVDAKVYGLEKADKPGTLPGAKMFKASIRFTVDQLIGLHKKVIVVTAIPHAPNPFSKVTIQPRLFNKEINEFGESVQTFNRQNQDLLAFFRSLASKDLEVLDAAECLKGANKYILEKNGHLLYRDEVHLSRFGAYELAKKLQPSLP